MSQIDTNPTSCDMASTETLPLSVDFTEVLGLGETISAPVAVLMDTSSNILASYGLSGSPSVSGNIATQVITSLLKNHVYSLFITVVILNKTTTWTTRTVINCVA